MTGSVVGGGNRVGGIVGGHASNATLTIERASVIGPQVAGRDHVGGVAGAVASTSHSLLVNASFAITQVTATGNFAGGLLRGAAIPGDNVAIDNVYFIGEVSGAQRVGGLVGALRSAATLTDSYASATVSGRGGPVLAA